MTRRPVHRLICCLVAGLHLCPLRVHAQTSREVTYDARAIIRLNAHLRMTTIVVLPENEEILDYVCGDKDFWIVSGAQNLAYVKPAKAGATTNLNLVTAAGHVYSFLLTEGSRDPDLKVFVIADPHLKPTVAMKTPVSQQLEEANHQLSLAREATDKARRDAEDAKRAIDRFKASYPFQMRFPYAFEARTKPFNVTAIFHDDRFTYIRAEGRELPAVYEVVDHVPNLVSYQIEQGVYVISKVIDHGYLAIGKRRLAFDAVSDDR
jgi:type IV secretion system protein VirB9